MFVALKPRAEWTRATTQVELVGLDGNTRSRTFAAARSGSRSRSKCGSTKCSPACGPTWPSSSSATTSNVLIPKANEIGRRACARFPAAPTWPSTTSRASRSCRSSSTANRSPATAFRPKRCWTSSNRSRARPWARSSKANCPFPWRPAARTSTATAPQHLARLMLATPSGDRIPLTRVADVREVRGAKYHHPRMEQAPDHDPVQRARPRHRQLRRRSAGPNRRRPSNCRAAIGSSGAASSRTCGGPRRG